MSGWLLFVYCIGAGWTWLAVTRRVLNSTAKDNLRFRSGGYRADEPLVDGEDKGLALLLGFIAAPFWPGVLLGLVILRSPLLTTEVEKQHAQRIELEKLRKLARDHKLPMPGDEQ